MAKMKKDPSHQYKMKLRQTPADPILDADFTVLDKDPTIRIIITVDDEGYIKSYNHPLTPSAEKLKNETNKEPYRTSGIYDLVTISLITYIEQGKTDDDVEIGYWKMTSGGKLMIS